MVNFEQALEIAKKLKRNIDACSKFKIGRAHV